MTIAYRDMDAHDEKFVVDSWVKSYRESDHSGLIQNADWYGVMIPQLTGLVRRPGVHTVIAFDPQSERSSDIYGWLCIEQYRESNDREMRTGPVPLVYYVFVKSAYRKHGIARGLFRAAEVDLDRPFYYACKTYVVDQMDDLERYRLMPYARFRPMLGRH